MIHIMLVHRSGWQRGFPNVNSNVFDVDGKWQRSIFSAIANVDHAIAVDTFFVIGGLLISQSILNSMEKKCFNIPKMYLHRYLRTTPVLALLILIILSILKFLGNGPYFDYFINIAFVKSCEKNWWAALLHIQNYYDPLGACLQASWYLSVDFQLVLLSPLLLYPIYKWGWKFLWLLPTYVVAIEVWAFVVSFKNKYKAARLLMPPEVGQTFGVDFYFPTHIRMGPWLIGVMMGYIFYSTKHKKVIINKYLNIAMWLLSIGTMTAILVGMLPLQNAKYPANQFANSLWIAFTRNNWGYSIAWIIFACQNGSGGVIKWFLEHPLWQPLGRMSLSFYLVHSIYQIISIGSGKVPQYFSTTNVVRQ
ncbi:CLUMA_CG016228, isoform A [Clunio marinus]|uniref:CLUMA_CG016228, isoform A n=1 Tax=Clunio marinus TaxID=568069 RepID=A0A1J1IU78_9DIPT|nr:CLUMA_CG016228, isoform A [Clunio marinus]